MTAVRPPVAPMLAKLVREIPEGDGWLYEPKWDGFRAVVFREGDDITIGSRNGQPLARYFPELLDIFRARLPERVVLDGEIVMPGPGGLEFEALQLRLHPAASRVAKLAAEIPASFTAFDLLSVGDDDLRDAPLTERRARLVAAFAPDARCFQTPQTDDATIAAGWFERFEGAGLDGVIAKRAEGKYLEGQRAMVKIKHERTIDCVVGGYRLTKDQTGVASLLLGIHDETGAFFHIGFASAFKARDRIEMLPLLEPFRGDDIFEDLGNPGAQSRWSGGKDMTWYPLKPALVCEVAFDHMQGHRMRHAARFKRWRPDRDAASCTTEQLVPPTPFSLDEIIALARG